MVIRGDLSKTVTLEQTWKLNEEGSPRSSGGSVFQLDGRVPRLEVGRCLTCLKNCKGAKVPGVEQVGVNSSGGKSRRK